MVAPARPPRAAMSTPSETLPRGALSYSPEQRRVIDWRGGHLQVVASAGAGKTEVLAQRIATLLDEGVVPRAIVAFTYTREAAAALKARVLRKAQRGDDPASLDRLSPMFVGTIHAWCQQLLKERAPRYATFELYTDHRLVALLTREFDALGLGALGIDDRVESVRAFLETAEAVENELIAPSSLPAGPFRTAYENYLAALDRYHVLTFQQAIARAIEELSRPEVSAQLRASLEHLIVDEFQDINPAQARLISLLGRSPVKVCVVGDDDQSIYQWRGSSVHFIRRFAERFSAHTETLAVNRRSRPAIVAAAARFAHTLEDRLPKEIRASRDDHDRAVIPFVAPDARREAELIADAVEAMHARGVPWRSVAVLFRAMFSARPFLEVFDARKIPYRCEGRSALFLQPEVEALAHCLAWIAGRSDFYNARAKQKVPLALDAVVARMRDVFALPPPRAAFLPKIMALLQAALPSVREADVVGLCYRLLSAMGVADWDLHDPEVARRLGALGRFSQCLADYESVARRGHKRLDRVEGRRQVAAGSAGGAAFLDGLIEYITYYAQDAYRDFAGEPDLTGDAVVFSTVHAAKGLEWPVVFVPCLTDGRFPSSYTGRRKDWLIPRDLFPAARYEGSDDDERRLFYVAMTRARDHLYLSTHQRDGRRFAAPSRYLRATLDALPAVANTAPWTPDALPPEGRAPEETPSLSFSHLAQYKTCPLQYRLRVLLGFEAPCASQMGYGGAVHHMMRRVAEHTRAFGALPDGDDLDRLFDREFYLPYADGEAWTTMEARARSLVEAYLRDFPDDLQRVWEVERPFELHLPHANVSGRADVILDREGGVAGALALVDYKTRRVARDDAGLDLQLQAYTAAARGEGFDVRAGYLHDLTASKGHARRPVDTADTPVRAATAALDAAAQGIRARALDPAPGPHCAHCDVRPLCRHAAPAPTEDPA